jgi:endonuclease/exonuclease/phosphatase (EEP) superfamily protein YafD
VGLVAHLVAERQWWSTFLLYVPQLVYGAPVLVLLPLALLVRSGMAMRLLAATLLIIVGPLMGWQVGWSRRAPKGAAVVRVLEYNLDGGQQGFEAIASQIDHYQPDLVIFPEARYWHDEAGFQKHLATRFPGWSSLLGGDVYVATRWPVVARDAAAMDPFILYDPSMDRKMPRIIVDAPFGRFAVVGVHFWTAMHGETIRTHRRTLDRYLQKTAQIRIEQADAALRWTGGLHEPMILAGDFNTPPGGMIYRRLTSRFSDTFAEVGTGWGCTYPNRFPLLRIDYIFHSPEWTPLRCEVGGPRGSDHRPFFAELALRKQ